VLPETYTTVGLRPVTTADESARFCADLVAGLADADVDVVFVSPGSRSTPLTLAFAADPRVRDISIRDERSAGFAALGYGKATGRPAAVVCTSGTAPTHYFPAIVEANQAGSPLIVLTSDRPARFRGTGAPQTTNQINLYGSQVKWFTDLTTTDPSGRDTGRMIASVATVLPSGPVHANIAFDEPLLPDVLPTPRDPQEWMAPDEPSPRKGTAFDPLVGRNVLIVASGRQREDFSDAVNLVAEALAAPVMSDPQCWVTGPNTVAYGDLLSGNTDALDVAPPDVVLRLGPIPTSKALWTWLERSGVEQILVDSSRLTDPLLSARTVVDADPGAFLRANLPDATNDRAFLDIWLDMDGAVQVAAAGAMAELPFPNEPEIARTLAACTRTGGSLYVGSSMPIRDLGSFGEPRSDISVLANRGVNGIDGTISSALGAALSGTPVTLLLGDIAALHDATALSEVARIGAPVRVVVINNDGGGIFSFLPQATSGAIDAETFERHWGTAHGLSLVGIAESMGLDATRIDTFDEYAKTLSTPIDTPHLIELPTNRSENVKHHKTIRSAVRSAARR
jgi:2-succinyl-5-enolpyruvyl-6-hydroxy-3-cyclohexene-1-carboxylate synthase